MSRYSKKTISVYRCPPSKTETMINELFRRIGLIGYTPKYRNEDTDETILLLPSFIFVHDRDVERIEIAHTQFNFLEMHRMTMNQKYVKVAPEELKQIKNFNDLKNNLFTSIINQYILILGDEVLINEGPFTSACGIVTEIDEVTRMVRVNVGSISVYIGCDSCVRARNPKRIIPELAQA